MDEKNKEEKENQIEELKKELEFYKSVFKTHSNSAVFNLRIKTLNGEKIWIDKVRQRCDRQLILSLEQDDETRGWLEHVRCER
uniref:Uncharacterized protein n=1 Tax=viral metagenome TaxID=1070528 RepID=A0A6C0BTQ4_9ZZZZ